MSGEADSLVQSSVVRLAGSSLGPGSGAERGAADRLGTSAAVDLSVIIPVTDRYDDVETTYWSYKRQLEQSGLSFDMTYVLVGQRPALQSGLESLNARGEPIKVVTLADWFGEATAIAVGASRSSGKLILTLPAYLQIDPAEIPRFIGSRGGFDLIVAARDRSGDRWINRMQSKAFHWFVNRLLGSRYVDLGNSVRLFRREVIEEVKIYADQHRFLPLLVERHGFTVDEVVLRQAEADRRPRLYRMGVYVRRMLDIIVIYFLLKFTSKPFRFFGLIGLSIAAIGVVSALWLGIERVFGGVAVADRPLLVIAALLIVLGVQAIAMGLIGEIIIFTRSAGTADYWIEKTVKKDDEKSTPV